MSMTMTARRGSWAIVAAAVLAGCEGELVTPAGGAHPGPRAANDAGASRPLDAVVGPPSPTPGATPGTACTGNPVDVPLTAEQRTALRALGPVPLAPPPDPTN